MTLKPVIACTLNANDQAARVAAFADLGRRALLETEEIASGLRLHFSAGRGIRGELERLIQAESECCSFLDFQLDANEVKLALDVTGPEQAQPIIRELFESETESTAGK